MALLKDRPFCMNCAYWGEMGMCRVQSGTRSIAGISWAQTVTTEHQDTCDAFRHRQASTIKGKR